MYVLLSKFVGIDEFFQTHTKFCDLDLHIALQWTMILTLAFLFSFATSISYTNSEYLQLQGYIHISSFSFFQYMLPLCNPVFSPYIYDVLFHFETICKLV